MLTPITKCRLRLLRLERIKDYLLLEEEYILNQEQRKPAEEKNEEDVNRVDELRGSPLSVGNLEEIIDEQHAIVSSSIGPEYYVNILSFVDKDLLEPGCSVLLHNKTSSIVGILNDEVDPLISVMKVEKAPLETYADIGGLEKQIQSRETGEFGAVGGDEPAAMRPARFFSAACLREFAFSPSLLRP
ncbi:putative 26S protease regulatory subunit 4 [Toxoplasma gondii TgCatPRC2]|uniref:Putative 26S protease regulatory subunit 4 n=1 Tax=Toxoplasma gondii TgCatPRC2 TaxID=1130821 RepID=A0A151H6N1_TOXGO|nr:putative 26S protease regulatory subunit 4 [Toxoplasma gondii TgCatPRC2]